MPPRAGAPMGPGPPTGLASVSPDQLSSGVSCRIPTIADHSGIDSVTSRMKNPVSRDTPLNVSIPFRFDHAVAAAFPSASGGDTSSAVMPLVTAAQFLTTTTAARYMPSTATSRYAVSFVVNASARKTAAAYRYLGFPSSRYRHIEITSPSAHTAMMTSFRANLLK